MATLVGDLASSTPVTKLRGTGAGQTETWVPKVKAPPLKSRALRCYAISTSPAVPPDFSSGNVDKMIAKLHLKLHEYTKAVEDILVALKINPKDKELYLMLGDAYDQVGLRKKGAQARLKALELENEESATTGLKALRVSREALEQGRWEEAVMVATMVLDNPEVSLSPALQAELYRVISDSHSRMGRPVEAVEAERIAVEACPEDAVSRLVLAEREMELAHAQHDLDAVLALATRGILLCQELQNEEMLHCFHRSRGKALFAQGHVEEALEDFRAFHRLRPDLAEPLLLLSDAYDLLNRPQAAVDAQERAVRLEPQNHRAKVVLAGRLSKLIAASHA